MPRAKIRQYGVQSKAGEKSTRPTPAVGDRIFLVIQNTGANPGLLRFGGPVRGDGSDLLFAAGSAPLIFDQADSCPNDDLNFQSTLGTSWAVLERVVGSNG
jgi:hypothetical protein